jgi:hypothetical protein
MCGTTGCIGYPFDPGNAALGVEIGEKQERKSRTRLRHRSDAMIQGGYLTTSQQPQQFAWHHENGIGRIGSRHIPVGGPDLQSSPVRLSEAQQMPVLMFMIDRVSQRSGKAAADLDHRPSTKATSQICAILHPAAGGERDHKVLGQPLECLEYPEQASMKVARLRRGQLVCQGHSPSAGAKKAHAIWTLGNAGMFASKPPMSAAER